MLKIDKQALAAYITFRNAKARRLLSLERKFFWI
jgi:hypothetical protein